MINQTTEYALRAVVFLATEEHPRTTAAIATATEVPNNYLSKVLQGLTKAGLVAAHRGIHGGFTLVTPPNELTVLEVINSVEPIQRYPECPLGIHGTQLCPLHQSLDDVGRMVQETFGTTTIADLNSVPQANRPLCSMPD